MNKFDTKCYHCNRQVKADEGVLLDKLPSGKWRVECGPGRGHNAAAGQRTARPKVTMDDLDDLMKFHGIS